MGKPIGFLISFLFMTLATAPFAGAAKLVNLGSEFEAFLAASQGQAPDQVEKNWEAFESHHQKIYNEAIYRKDTPGWEARLRTKRDVFFAKLPTFSAKMVELFNHA